MRAGGGVVQGGSSITQQLAKNLFLTNERSLERKIKEAFLALWLEFHLTKNEILKLYLDRAYMGGGTFGVVGGGGILFRQDRASDITLAEAAMLAGLFKAPTKYAPHVNLPAARARANDVLQQHGRGRLPHRGPDLGGPAQSRDAGRPQAARSRPTAISIGPSTRSRSSPTTGKLGNDRVLTVRTPLDIAIQKQAEQAIEDMLRQYGDQYDAEAGRHGRHGPRRRACAPSWAGAITAQSQFNRATDAAAPARLVVQALSSTRRRC